MPDSRLSCSWCGAESPSTATACSRCGAPLEEATVVTASGWRKVPKVADETDVGFSKSTCQVAGQIVPMVSIDLAGGDSVYFEHHALLWADEGLRIGEHKTEGGLMSRLAGGAPTKLMTATGPGRLAISRDSIGELVVLPVGTKHEVDVTRGAFVLATHSLRYAFEKTGTTHVERFTAHGEDGLLMIHGTADVFERTLGAGETIYVEPGAFLYKDATVKDEQFKEPGVRTGGLGGAMHTGGLGGAMHMVELTGPGRVAIQSMYHGHREEG